MGNTRRCLAVNELHVFATLQGTQSSATWAFWIRIPKCGSCSQTSGYGQKTFKHIKENTS